MTSSTVGAAIFLLALPHAGAAQMHLGPLPNRPRIDLASNWSIQSSAKVAQGGAQISTAGFDSGSWYPATVPSTAIAALVSDGVFPDPYYAENLRSIPGTTYPWGDNFAVDSMPADSPYAVSW